MLPRRLSLALLIAASVLAAGCIKDAARSLGELHAVRNELRNAFGDDVSVHLGQAGINTTLTITFINSPLNERAPEERSQRAKQAAQLVIARYVRIASVTEIWVTFIRQQTRLVFFNYREGFEVYGFDNKGGGLSLPSYAGQAAPPPDSEIIAGYTASVEQTDVSPAANLQLDGEPGGYGITVLPHLKLQGDARRRRAPAPNEALFYFASYAKTPRFAPVISYEFIADGKPLVQGTAPFTGDDAQYCFVRVPYPMFRELIAAKSLAIKLGAREYPLTPEQLELLQKMDAYVLP